MTTDSSPTGLRPLRIAVEGCGHGTLHAIYTSVQKSCEQKNWENVDLLIICGDFEAIRNAQDLNCMAVPQKYREMGDFHEYYSGLRKAPFLTIFIGGNHEASNYLWELYYGGWVAPNIYYMGAANVLRFGPIRIAGLSGIWKGHNYNKPHFERLPYNDDDIRSIYHVRELDVRKLMQIRTQIDIGISHDWPRTIESHGNYRALFAAKDQFQAESEAGTLGSTAAKYVLDRLRPAWWFSAHLHVKFSALYKHDSNANEDVSTTSQLNTELDKIKNADEIDLDLDGDAPSLEEAQLSSQQQQSISERQESFDQLSSLRSQLPESFSKPHDQKHSIVETPPEIANKTTKFLALDKCLPYRKFLQLLEITALTADPAPLRLEYDREWLAITRVFSDDLVLDAGETDQIPAAKPESVYKAAIEQAELWVDEHLVSNGKMTVPQNFELTAPIHSHVIRGQEMPNEYSNPQTTAFCALIGIMNKFDSSDADRAKRMGDGPRAEKQRTDAYRHGTGAPGSRGSSRGRGRGRGHW